MLLKNGYVEAEINPSINLFNEVNLLKKEKNAVILAHYYQNADIQDIADYIGDSLGLAQQAAKTNAEIILFAGVHFMAETAKILNPKKKVLIPDLNAGCSLADSCPPTIFSEFKKAHPDHIVITYINCTAEIKALSDVIVTSTNAVQIVESFPKDQKIIFAPDKNLGAYINKKTGRNMVLWDGACMVHEIFSLKKLLELKLNNPNAQIIAHPECEEEILNYADFIGSTTALLNYTKSNKANEFIVLTETGILHQMQKNSPNKTFIPAPPENNCACNDCPHMKLNTLEKIYLTLKHEQPELHMSDDLLNKAKNPILKMMELSAKFGL
ncbi:MAG: quinolinate synthase NadA [Sphingobacteriaceae bacterium]|nr:quinolinate synthase NadA [Sphingobacteriaceae bacterium]